MKSGGATHSPFENEVLAQQDTILGGPPSLETPDQPSIPTPAKVQVMSTSDLPEDELTPAEFQLVHTSPQPSRDGSISPHPIRVEPTFQPVPDQEQALKSLEMGLLKQFLMHKKEMEKRIHAIVTKI